MFKMESAAGAIVASALLHSETEGTTRSVMSSHSDLKRIIVVSMESTT